MTRQNSNWPAGDTKNRLRALRIWVEVSSTLINYEERWPALYHRAQQPEQRRLSNANISVSDRIEGVVCFFIGVVLRFVPPFARSWPSPFAQVRGILAAIRARALGTSPSAQLLAINPYAARADVTIFRYILNFAVYVGCMPSSPFISPW